MKLNLEPNVADTEEYQHLGDKWQYLLDERYFQKQEELELSGGIRLVYRDYSQENGKVSYQARRMSVLDGEHEIFHRDCLLDIGQIITHEIIHHQDGHRYLLLREELYGYTVINLDDRTQFRYIPQSLLRHQESFIWVIGHYNPKSNLLAVEGCYWACPYSTLVVDFSEPVPQDQSLPHRWLDLNDLLYEKEGEDKWDIEDVCFVRWEEDGGITVKAEFYQEEQGGHRQERTFSPEELYQLLRNASH